MAEVQARAVYDFSGEGQDELSFKNGDILTVVRKDVGEGWWEARTSRGEVGLVPEAYMEITAVPEPQFPPPPPPSSVAIQNNARAPWQPPPAAINRQDSRDSWQAPQPSKPAWQGHAAPPPVPVAPRAAVPVAPRAAAPLPAASSWGSAGNHDDGHRDGGTLTNNQHGGAAAKQESYDDWDDDDWDDDDDSVTTESSEYPSSYADGSSRRQRKEGDEKRGSVRKPLVGKFSAFNKQFVDGYLFDFSALNVPASEKKVIVLETMDGYSYKPTGEKYTCVIRSPKKETKFHGMKSFIAYQVTPTFSGIQVSRRYKHFDWLHDRLVEKYSSVAVPPLPEKQIAGRFEEDFINARLRQLQQWMDRMCQHPVISQSEVILHFLSCTDDKKWKVGKRAAEKDQFMAGRFFLTVETPTMPLEGTDARMEKFARYVKSMDDSVRHLITVTDSNVKKHESSFRKEFRRIGGSFVALAKSFEHDERSVSQNLTKAIEHTGRTYESVGEMYKEQPRHDMQYLLEGLHEYKGLLAVWPDILSVNRSVTSKIQESVGKFSESEIQAVQGKADVIAFCLLAEMNQFNEDRVVDFKKYMQQYLQGQIQFYQEITRKLQETLSQYDDA